MFAASALPAFAQKSRMDSIFKAAVSVSESKNVTEAQARYAALQKNFPESESGPYVNMYDIARAGIAGLMIKENHPDALKMARSLNAVLIRRQFQGGIGRLLVEKGRAADAEAIYREEMEKARPAGGAMDSATYFTYSVYYADLLYKTKRYSEALAMIDQADKARFINSVDQEALMVNILMENKENDRAYMLLDRLVKNGRSNESTRANLKKMWIATGKPAKDFDTYLAGLSDTLRQKSLAKVKEHSVNYPAVPFTLRDLKGKTVSLASLKGKVVFLDFWATWCGPCVASFPVMQAAADKYKGKVEFLFIDTWEKSPDEAKRIKEVSDFIKKGKYRFTVLLDSRDETDRSKYDVVSQYKVKGIPAKFIIDKEGIVRYAFTGFSGSFDASLTEIDLFLESLL